MRKATSSFVMFIQSVRLSSLNQSPPVGRIFMKFEYFSKIYEESARFIKIWQEYRTIHEHFGSHLSQFLEWEMFQTKVVHKFKTHILCSITFFFLQDRSVYEIMWINTAQPDRPQMAIWRMSIACWITSATNTQSRYVMLSDFPLQQLLHENASVWRTYIGCHDDSDILGQQYTYNALLLFHGHKCYENVLQCYVLRTMLI